MKEGLSIVEKQQDLL